MQGAWRRLGSMKEQRALIRRRMVHETRPSNWALQRFTLRCVPNRACRVSFYRGGFKNSLPRLKRLGVH